MVTEMLELGGARFERLCVRRTGVAVFRGPGRYLRVGTAVLAELDVHRQMIQLGYPVPDILETGEHDGTPYVIETSMGEPTLGDAGTRRSGDHEATDQELTAVPTAHGAMGSRAAGGTPGRRGHRT